MVWLTVPGRKSGILRTAPLLGAPRADGSWIVAGSGGGDSVEPSWSINTRAAAASGALCYLEYAGNRWPVRVQVLQEEEERASAYGLLVGRWRFFADYAKRAGRTIPVFVLQPSENG